MDNFMTSNDKRPTVSVENKYAMDIGEAVEYFGIGEKKLRQLIAENLNSGFVLQNGIKYLLKRKQFEQFLDARTSI